MAVLSLKTLRRVSYFALPVFMAAATLPIASQSPSSASVAEFNAPATLGSLRDRQVATASSLSASSPTRDKRIRRFNFSHAVRDTCFFSNRTKR